MVRAMFIGSHGGSGTVGIIAIIVAVEVEVLVCGILNRCYVRRKSLLLSLLLCYGLLCSGQGEQQQWVYVWGGWRRCCRGGRAVSIASPSVEQQVGIGPP
jgi:hypothetical protein